MPHTMTQQDQMKLQKVSDKWSGSMDYHSLTGTISGPASTKRPTKSELKRKYPNEFSSDDGESDADSTYHGFADKDEKSTFVPRRLFKSGKTPAKSKQKTTSRKLTVETDEELTDTQTSSQDTYPQNKRRKLSFEKAAAPYESEKVSSRTKKQKFTSPLNFISTSQVDYEWVYDMGCTPDKVRSQAESSRELLSRSNLESSPSPPPALSSLSSPLIGVSDRSSSVPGDLGNKGTPQTNLTDSFKMVLEKSGMPESEEEPLDVGTLDLSETVGMDFDRLEKVIVEKKTSKPLLDNDDVEEVLKSSRQFITSALQTEQNKRMNAVKMFQSVVLDALTRMNRDLKEAQEHEMRAALLWTQEMSNIKRTIRCQEKEMNQLKKAHDLLMCDLQSAQPDGETVQKSLRTAMKRDTDALQKKLIAKCNQQALKALDALKTRLQMSLFS